MLNQGWNLEHSYTALPTLFYHRQMPASAPNPQMVVFNASLAKTLGLDADALQNTPSLFVGSSLPSGANPIAQAYAGYQFGHFSMLGDGRAVLLGEQIAPDGRRFDIQLKGSGKTPYSRGGDGLAALAPMLREYIISEAMFALGIPTTRSLAVVLTGQDVIRESVLQGAMLTRVASSHIRVGTFHYVSAFGSENDLRILADYCIVRHFPWIEDAEDRYLLLLREVCRRQASLIAQWQLIGFIHGVMNTDNMAISGETIDYGPCAFMDTYDPGTVFSSIDTAGRYAYQNQPGIGAWNLSRFAEDLLPLLDKNQNKAIELAQGEIEHYWTHYHAYWTTGMRAKLGFLNEEPEDKSLAQELLDLMAKYRLDYTHTFRSLSFKDNHAEIFSSNPALASWHEKWQIRLDRQPQCLDDSLELMQSHNPAVIPRNHRVEEALEASGIGDFSVMERLLEALSKPFEDAEKYALPPEPTACRYQTFCGT